MAAVPGRYRSGIRSGGGFRRDRRRGAGAGRDPGMRHRAGPRWDQMTGGSSKSNHGGGNRVESRGIKRVVVDREAGELSSGSGSDDSEKVYRKHANGLLPSPNNKRKFSPIVLDLNKNDVSSSNKKNAEVLDHEPVPMETEDDDFVLARHISLSRWADGNGTDDVGTEDFEAEIVSRRKNIAYVEAMEQQYQEKPPILEPSQPPKRYINMLQGCRSVDEFEILDNIGEGTYGVVSRAKNKKTGEIVALKKVKMEVEKEGFPPTALREINILLSLHHPSIVDVKEVVMESDVDGIFMVMEYMEHDLKCVLENMMQHFSLSDVKCLMFQLFEGVNYLHDNWVLHRDLKTSNLLLNNRGELKICDFGLSRQYSSPFKPYTPLVVTLWYRAPELLLGAKEYSTAIDMWSLGCIMAELLAKEPLFNGKTELDQLDKIFRTLGTPNEKIWPGFPKLPGAKINFVKQPPPELANFTLALMGFAGITVSVKSFHLHFWDVQPFRRLDLIY